MKNQGNLDWVQMLRGIAAMLVVLCHARYAFLGTGEWALADGLLLPGASGVDLFFVISGFIMCYSTAGADGSPGDVARFIVKRFARVWPVLAVAVIVFIMVERGGMSYLHKPGSLSTLLHTLALIPTMPSAAPYFELSHPVAWTLQFEMYFYLMFAASMLFRSLRWLVLLAWVGATVLWLPRGPNGLDLGVGMHVDYAVAYMQIVTSPFVLEFVAGVAIGWLYLSDRVRIGNRALAAHLLFLGCAFALWCLYAGVVGKHGPAGWGLPMALLVLCMAIASKTVDIAVPRLCLWLGEISYSLYLMHLVAQSLARRGLVLLDREPLTHSWGYVFISTCLTVSLAALSHHYLEQRLSNAVRRWLFGLLPARKISPVETATKPVVGGAAGTGRA